MFCHTVPSCVTDVDQQHDGRKIQAWLKLLVDYMSLSEGRTLLFQTALLPYQRTFADVASF